MYSKVHCNTIHSSQYMEVIYMSIHRWMDKETMVHISSGILLTCKTKRWNLAICIHVYEARDCHTKWSKSEREKQILYIKSYVWNLDKWYWLIYLWGRNKDANVDRGWKGECGMNWESSINIYTLPCAK